MNSLKTRNIDARRNPEPAVIRRMLWKTLIPYAPFASRNLRLDATFSVKPTANQLWPKPPRTKRLRANLLSRKSAIFKELLRGLGKS